MCATHADHKPNAIISLLQNKCPRCRRGDLFVRSSAYDLKQYRFMQMHGNCPVCNQVVDIEVGFYYGTGFVSYALAIALSVASFIAWWVLVGVSLEDNRVFWWLGVNALLLVVMQPLLMRLSRTLWLWFFVGYSRNWKEGDVYKVERINEGLKDAW
ncbi:DUF983 domain-containing protein [Sediminibacterium ginsengisoli]|uniref:DUF983 domain-containing protein n=1 Tax=Sediminibacterium ginsengisoli TaxID=413434 RepID=A0A1T4NUY8_9BACT|nr:DUF983 domain-containing protein [Sediminibacterium ginsengisoli]SJZ83170.1 hypothetical protein SAMN04488132_1054 [Sediminibacterium ginsengisoli]